VSSWKWEVFFQHQNAPKIVWRPGSAWTRWGACGALQDALAGFGEGRRGKGRGEKERRKGECGRGYRPTMIFKRLFLWDWKRLVWSGQSVAAPRVIEKFPVFHNIREQWIPCNATLVVRIEQSLGYVCVCVCTWTMTFEPVDVRSRYFVLTWRFTLVVSKMKFEGQGHGSKLRAQQETTAQQLLGLTDRRRKASHWKLQISNSQRLPSANSIAKTVGATSSKAFFLLCLRFPRMSLVCYVDCTTSVTLTLNAAVCSAEAMDTRRRVKLISVPTPHA